MTGVETIARIRFEHFQNRKGIKQIARELGIARDTVRKVLRSDATEFNYKRTTQPQPKLGPWVETLTAILEAETKVPKRERRSTQRLFEELRGRGYDGAHDSVHRFVKAWRAEHARAPVQASIPLSFDPGEAYQFDWSHDAIESKRWVGTLSRSGGRFGIPAPRHEFVDAVLGPTVYEARQQLGHVGQRINFVELTGLDQ